MSRVNELYSKTKEMLTILQNAREKERENTIDQLNGLIEERDTVIAKIKGPYTEEELKIGQEIVMLNEQIKINMDQLYSDVKSDLKKVKLQKERNRSYINPYGQIKTTDGMYLDTKH